MKVRSKRASGGFAVSRSVWDNDQFDWFKATMERSLPDAGMVFGLIQQYQKKRKWNRQQNGGGVVVFS